MAFYGAIEQVLTGWIFGLLEQGDDDYERAKRLRGGHDLRRPRGARVGTVCLTPATMTDNEMVKRLMWAGLLAGLGLAGHDRDDEARAPDLACAPSGKIPPSERQGEQRTPAEEAEAAAAADEATAQATRVEGAARVEEVQREVAETDVRRIEEEREKAEQELEKLSRKERKAREKAEKEAAEALEAREKARRPSGRRRRRSATRPRSPSGRRRPRPRR